MKTLFIKKGSIKTLLVFTYSLFAMLYSSTSLAESKIQNPAESTVTASNQTERRTTANKYAGITITVNINTASRDELATLLLGIGEGKAQLIVDYREKYGPFESVEQLMDVKGVGPSTLEKNRDRILL